MLNATRPAAVAGRFYPGDAPTLARMVGAQLQQARAALEAVAPRPTEDHLTGGAGAAEAAPRPCPKMLLVPHAGFIYSGPTAAAAYTLLAPWRERIRRVVLLGPGHRVAVNGLAAPMTAAFETPLGRVAIDRDALAELMPMPFVGLSETAHEHEHSLEVQLPFLQAVLAPGFTLLPLVVGRASEAEVAQVIDTLWGGDETLVLISSDLSHYHPYDEAQAIDRETIDRVLGLDGRIGHEQACGATPLRGALKVARARGLQARLLDLRNSGDTAGDRSRVVGYAAVAFEAGGSAGADRRAGSTGATLRTPGPDMPGPGTPGSVAQAAAGVAAARDALLGATLLARAHNAIARVLGQREVAEPAPTPELQQALRAEGATFVTLNRDHHLRGCIGTLKAHRPLDTDVQHNAMAAAFRDPRFAPLSVAEWPGLAVEVSLLDAPQPLPAFATEAEALSALVPGEDGVILQWGSHRATFLPQVWEQLPEPREFMAALKRKAGLPMDFWAPDVQLQRYRVRKYKAPPIGR